MASLEVATSVLLLFAEPTRLRLLALLGDHELTVAELVAITELGQSRVSMHLGKLREAGVLRDRKSGTSTFYALSDQMPSGVRPVWDLVRGQVDDAILEADRARSADLLRARRASHPWPDALAGQMERHYSPGRTWESLTHGLAGLMHLGDVLDIGCGDGAVAELLTPRSKSMTCLDTNERMVAAATERLARFDHARVVHGDMQALPFRDASFDHAVLFNVLVHATSPAKAVAEAARVLRKGGALVVVTLDAHHQEDVAQAWGHVHRGFSPAALKKLLVSKGLDVTRCEVTARERRPPYFQVVTATTKK